MGWEGENTGWTPELEELEARRLMAAQMGGADKVEIQHGKGKLTVLERISQLVDEGSFREIGELSGFATAIRENVVLQVDVQTRLDVPLGIGSLSETVQVTGDVSPVNTSDASMGNVMTTDVPLVADLDGLDDFQSEIRQQGAERRSLVTVKLEDRDQSGRRHRRMLFAHRACRIPVEIDPHRAGSVAVVHNSSSPMFATSRNSRPPCRTGSTPSRRASSGVAPTSSAV